MSSPLTLCAVPPSLKPIAHYLKTANEHANRDPVITYWARLSALQTGLGLDKKSKEALELLLPLMEWLEKEKKVLKDQDTISNEVVAAAHVENYALKLFMWADKEDRASRFGKNVVKSFYTAGILYDVLTVFGELSPENAHARKYAKWKAAHIHTCLKNGETPIAGPVNMDNEEGEQQPDDGVGGASASVQQPGPSGWVQPQIPPPSEPAAPEPPKPAPRRPVPPPEVELAPIVTPTIPALADGIANISLSPALTSKAQKYCKYATSALDYEDRMTAIENLTKALNILKTGQED